MQEKTRRVANRRTKSGHSVNLIQRCGEALDMLPLELAEAIGVPYQDVQDIWTGGRSDLIAVDEDPAMLALVAYVNKRIAALLGIREELQRKINLDRHERAEQRRRTLER